LVASLSLCLYRADKASTFYLLPTRAWELLLGSLGSLITPTRLLDRILRLAFVPALLALAVLPVVPFGVHPGTAALVICVATIVVILRKHPAMSRGAGMKSLARVGDISYSLYLVHWPIFAFYNNVVIQYHGESRPIVTTLALIGLAFVLAFLLNRYVEEPVRRANVRASMQNVGFAVVISIGLVVTGVAIAHAFSPSRDYAYVRRSNYGFSQSCEFQGDFAPLPECRNSDETGNLDLG